MHNLGIKKISQTIKTNDVWVADRNFCTVEFTFNIVSAGGYFVIRQHKKYPFRLIGKEKYIGKTETGKVYEQSILAYDSNGFECTFRRIRIILKKKTRAGDTEIFIISNLSKRAANAKKIAKES